MLGKKTLGVIMSLSLAASIVGPTLTVQAKPIVPTTKYQLSVGGYSEVQGNVEKIIEALKANGTIPENATPEEIQKIVKEYLKEDINKEPLSKEERKIAAEKMKKFENFKLTEYGLNNKNIEKLSKSNVDSIQPENWDKQVRTAKPLVILMDFQDYKFSDFTTKEKGKTEFMFDNFDQKHYQDMLFGEDTYKGPTGQNFITMKKYYKEQSGGSYTVNGGVVGPFTASKNAADYGAEVGKTHDKDARSLIREAVQLAAKNGVDLSQYDIENRAKGTMEPDGFIDHIIVVHAGMGQEAGGGSLGKDAIWAHRSSLGKAIEVEYTDKDGNKKKMKANDYTMQPQDGAPGVFCHEYGHDLGLPDEYDTDYTSDAGEPVGSWSIMSSGSWSGTIGGTEPTGFSPRCKAMLQSSLGGNWISGQEVDLDKISNEGIDLLLDQASEKGANNDVIQINLPDKETMIAKPVSGQHNYFGGYGHDGNPLKTSMSTNIDLTGKTNIKLKFNTNYDIEEGWDFGSVQVKEKGSDIWTAVKGNITTDKKANGAEITVAQGITGSSNGKWVDAEFDLSAYSGKNIELKFEYEADTYTFGEGFYVDDIKIESTEGTILEDNADGQSRFSQDGFIQSNGARKTSHYYLVEWRNHHGVDMGLAHKKYLGGNVSFNPGMVVWYVDDFYVDNHTGEHPGNGFIQVVDADQNPTLVVNADGTGTLEDTNRQIHDAAFSLRKGTNLMLDYNFKTPPYTIEDRNTFMKPVFDDSKDYSNKVLPVAGCIVPNYGLKVYVTGESKDRSVAKIHIAKTNK